MKPLRRLPGALLPALAMLLVCNGVGGQTSMDRFKELAAQVSTATATPTPDARVSEAMELVLDAVAETLRSGSTPTERSVRAAAEPFVQAVAATSGVSDETSATRYASLQVAAAVDPTRAAVCLNYGAASRLAVYAGKDWERLHLPGSVEWMAPWASFPRLAPDGAIVVVSQSVQDMGFRNGLRVYLLTRRADSYGLARAWARVTNLEYGGAKLEGSRLTIDSIDLPKGFLAAAASPLFERTEVYSIAGGDATTLSETLKHPELRFVDGWMVRARATKRPNSVQAALVKAAPTSENLDTYRVLRKRDGTLIVELQYADRRVVFTMLKTASGYRVTSVTGTAQGKQKD